MYPRTQAILIYRYQNTCCASRAQCYGGCLVLGTHGGSTLNPVDSVMAGKSVPSWLTVMILRPTDSALAGVWYLCGICSVSLSLSAALIFQSA